jgi:hypothetical protein
MPYALRVRGCPQAEREHAELPPLSGPWSAVTRSQSIPFISRPAEKPPHPRPPKGDRTSLHGSPLKAACGRGGQKSSMSQFVAPASCRARSVPSAMLTLATALRSRRKRDGIAMWLRYGSGLLMTGMLWGCAMVNGTPPPGSAPLFQADATDIGLLQAVHREQESLLSTCTQHQSCDQVHFTRAMIALFKNGEAAAASFQQTIAVAPNGPFADSSARWIRFLATPTLRSASADEPNGALLEVMKGLVHAWLEQQRAANASITSRTMETASSPDQVIHTLRQQIHNRDKRIAELTDQLSTLKRIDLDAHGPSKLNLPGTPSK